MAADRPLAERGIVEIKMGRSKFPGKPSKIGNRKRVNLSSCALPEDNDSSKAAKNIYLGLSVFNETFGDNEMVAPGPFHGFSMAEVEVAIAEARLQQREAEIEHKKQGMDINLWKSFQSELFSISSCSTENSPSDNNSNDVNDMKLSFDGGGSFSDDSAAESLDDSDELPSWTSGVKSVVLKGQKPVKISKSNSILKLPVKDLKKTVKYTSPRLKLCKMHCSPTLRKSLQSQAAKKLLEKAKMSNLIESNKNNSADKKFILPSHSIHSLRIIKPNKRFLEENANKRKLLRNRTMNCASESMVSKKAKVMGSLDESEFKISCDKKVVEELKTDSGCEENKKKTRRKEGSLEMKSSDGKCLSESQKNNVQESSTGKIILREARLQLDKSNLSLLEGPFSSPSASSLNLNSQLKVNPIQSVNSAGSIMCGVCGVVRFYRFVEPAKKFGIYCCEFCRNFITKIIETSEIDENTRLQCSEGKGLCGIFPIVKSQNFNLARCVNNCEACWLKLCLKNFNIPVKLRDRLAKLLPANMQMAIDLDPNLKAADNITNKFLLGNNIKDFKWLHENSSNVTDIKSMTKNENSDKQSVWTSSSNPGCKIEKSLRNRTLVSEGGLKLWQNEKSKAETEDKNRQSVLLKGPRVKNVCRSASVALGQPYATFPSESSPTKKQTNESGDECKNCDNLLTTNDCIESQETVDKSINRYAMSVDGKQEKKSIGSKPSAKSGKDGSQQTMGVKSKKKTNAKAENPISMDFWEIYDPEEICETGFGLIGSETFSVRALCFLCGSSGQEKLIHCASCCEPYHEFCVGEGQLKLQEGDWKYDWVCPRCTICFTCGRTSGQQLKCIKCSNSYHTECVDRVGGRLLHSPDRPWVCSVCLRCKSCNGVDVSVFVGNLPLCKVCFVLRQKGNYCPLCQRCYEDDDYECKMMECGQCKCWVHAKCEGLSDEKYQVLSFLPESVEYVCRMCCVMPPAPWWLAVESELRSGYLEVLKALSKNRKVCTMLKWSPRKQCTCRQVNYVSRALDFDDAKSVKSASNSPKHLPSEGFNIQGKDGSKVSEQDNSVDKGKEDKSQPAAITERKTSVEVINHSTGSLKLTLKILKGEGEIEEKEKLQSSEEAGDGTQTKNIRENTSRVKKCLSNEEKMEDLLPNSIDSQDDSQALHSLFKSNDLGSSFSDLSDKRSLASPSNPPSDSGIGSTDDELKASCLTDEESCKPDDQQSSRGPESKSSCDNSVSFFDEKRECFCFLESDSYNSRSKPFSPNLMSIKKKVTTSKYSSLHQFHQDMQRMIGTAQSAELMELYHQTIKEIFPWFDPKYSRVQGSAQKVSETVSVESTPIKSTPSKSSIVEECKIPKEKLSGQGLDYYYSDYVVEDNRMCLLCKMIGDGPPGETGRLLYCGQNDWVHCNCALWSGEVFEEIDGSLQNVHSAINRGRSIRCPECNLKGASIGCVARNCQETYHFSCARKVGCIFMDDKTIYCPTHVKESAGKLVQNEKEFEIRRPVYVELDKRKMKIVDSSQIRFAVGSLHVNNLGRFVLKLSDTPEAIIPEQFTCSRLFWSCYEPWRIVRYHFTVRLLEVEHDEGVDLGVNLTIDHSKEPELVELKLKQLRHFQEYNAYLEIDEGFIEERIKEKRKLPDLFKCDNDSTSQRMTSEESVKVTPIKRPKKEKAVKRIFDQFDSKEDENCLSDNQNTADLLPPDIEEAIFKDLPNDILDGISMQDIFMDINNVGGKEGITEDPSESDETPEGFLSRSKKIEFGSEAISQSEFWLDSNECNRQDTPEEIFSSSKSPKDIKKSKSEVLGNQGTKKGTALKAHQKSCSLNWNCKTEGSNNKWKKNSKCHVTVNLIEPQERGNMLQELKFTDGLVTISTGTIDSVKDLRARFEDSKRSIQQEEGKENKCLPWHTRLQPRLLQVDGGIDSSSSGSEAGESPQRLADENINSKIVAPPQSSPFSDSSVYSLYSPSYSGNSSYGLATDNLCPKFSSGNSRYSDGDYGSSETLMNLPQLDGVGDTYSDPSDSEDFLVEAVKFRKRPRKEMPRNPDLKMESKSFRISQCDGGIDSESDDGLSSKCTIANVLPFLSESSLRKDEPVKCKQCHRTYRTKISYQKHLETCCSDYMFSSSEGELSDEENSKKQLSNNLAKIKLENDPVWKSKSTEEVKVIKKNEISKATVPVAVAAPLVKPNSKKNSEKSTECTKKVEVKKEKVVKKSSATKKPVQDAKKLPPANNPQPMQHILIQQTNPAPPPQPSQPTQPTQPTLIVQDVTSPNIVPTAFIDPNLTVGYIATVNPPTSFAKPILATPNGIISDGFQFTQPAQAQISAGLCINPQNVQAGIPGIIIQQPFSPQGTLISSQPAPLIMPNDQLMLGPTGLLNVIQDPRTGGMFLASHNQPVFYNMETIVSNTVVQTDQYVSNFLATSYSQTSTQVFQTSEVEQVVNVPSNYIVVGPNTTATNKILTSDQLICVQTPQTIIPNQTQIQIPGQSIFNPSFQTAPAFTAEPKIISTPINTSQCLQPLQVQQLCPPFVLNEITSGSNHEVSKPPVQNLRTQETNLRPAPQRPALQPKAKPPPPPQPSANKRTTPQNSSNNVPTMETTSVKLPLKTYATPKSKLQSVQPRSRALVEYINNFRSDAPDTPLPVISKPRNVGLKNSVTQPQQPSPPPPPPPAAKPQTVSLSATTKATSKQSSSGSKDLQIPSVVPNVSPKPFPVTLPESVCSGTQPQSPTPCLKVPENNSSPLDTFESSDREISCLVTSSLSVVGDVFDIKVPETSDVSKLEVSQDSTKETFEASKGDSPSNVLTTVTDSTNSFTYGGDVKSCLSMPSLDDICNEEKMEILPTPMEEIKVKSEVVLKDNIETSEVFLKDCNQGNSEILPLQNNPQVINTDIKMASRSPQKVVPASLKNSSLPFDEKAKCKKKLMTSDQNSMEPTITKEDSCTVLEKEKPIFKNSPYQKIREDKGPKLIFDVTSDDGFKSSATSMIELWANICDSVQEMRAVWKIPYLPVSRKGIEVLGMQNHGLQHCLEQLRGIEQCMKYKCKYFTKEDAQKDEDNDSDIEKENLTGCARTEQFTKRKEYDMFAWLASKHRRLPNLAESSEEIMSSIRRANNLPMAMRYRNLKETAKLYVGVYRSKIHGKGLFCLREIEAGEMVIEYAGEVIRANLSDKREKYYTDKGIGCYMFRIDDRFVVDATMKGNAARFINHSCEPNCYSRVVDILGKKHIVIFALRRINIMEELTYDYKFPFEDEKISCHCLSKKCRKYLN